jgi:hypothetical protein
VGGRDGAGAFLACYQGEFGLVEAGAEVALLGKLGVCVSDKEGVGVVVVVVQA